MEKQSVFYETVSIEMRLRNYSHKTTKAYLSSLRSLVRHFQPRDPRELTNDDVRKYLLHMLEDEHCAAGTVNQAFNALRFLYVELYKKEFVIGTLPRPRREQKLPDVLNEDEVRRLTITTPYCVVADVMRHSTFTTLKIIS